MCHWERDGTERFTTLCSLYDTIAQFWDAPKCICLFQIFPKALQLCPMVFHGPFVPGCFSQCPWHECVGPLFFFLPITHSTLLVHAGSSVLITTQASLPPSAGYLCQVMMTSCFILSAFSCTLYKQVSLLLMFGHTIQNGLNLQK